MSRYHAPYDPQAQTRALFRFRCKEGFEDPLADFTRNSWTIIGYHDANARTSRPAQVAPGSNMDMDFSILPDGLNGIGNKVGKELAQFNREARNISAELITAFHFDVVGAHAHDEQFEHVFQSLSDFDGNGLG